MNNKNISIGLIPGLFSSSKNKLLVVFFILGILIRLVYLSYTPFDVRTHDVDVIGGHLDYIKFVDRNHRLPDTAQKSEQCWECYQRPLYYISAALIYSNTKSEGDPIAYVYLQMYSVMLFSGFLFFGILILRRLFEEKFYINVASALLVFWPSGIMHSVRISNEPMLYFFYAAGLFFFIKWYQNEKDKDIIISAIFACLATFSKSTGIILFFVILFFWGWKILLSKNKSIRLHVIFIVLGIFLLSSSPIIDDLASINFASNVSGMRLAGNSWNLNQGLFVGNGFKNYVFFDSRDFLTVPYTDTWNDVGGRQYFWNFLFKSSLLGEFRINLPLNYFFAKQMSALLLFMVFYALSGLVFIKSRIKKGFGILFVNAFFLLSSLFYFRMNVPAACSNDFRFIFPILISFVAFLVLSIKNIKVANYFKLARMGYIIIIIFILFSAAFFINPFVIMLQRM